MREVRCFIEEEGAVLRRKSAASPTTVCGQSRGEERPCSPGMKGLTDRQLQGVSMTVELQGLPQDLRSASASANLTGEVRKWRILNP